MVNAANTNAFQDGWKADYEFLYRDLKPAIEIFEVKFVLNVMVETDQN